MKNKKILVNLIATLGVVGSLSACHHVGTSNSVNSSNNLETSPAVVKSLHASLKNQEVKSDGKGGVTITNIDKPGFEGVTISIMPEDVDNETEYVDFYNQNIYKENSSLARYKSDVPVIMPHRTYIVSAMKNGLPQNLPFYIASEGALSAVPVNSVPSIFAYVMETQKIFYGVSNGKYQIAKAHELDKDTGNYKVQNERITITPFYAGDIKILFGNANQINSTESPIATIKVGKFINPVFEMKGQGSRAIIGKFTYEPTPPSVEGNKFNITAGGSLAGRYVYEEERYHWNRQSLADFLPSVVLPKEGRYWLITNGDISMKVDKSNDMFLTYDHDGYWIDFYRNYEKFNKFSTNLPVPVIFSVKNSKKEYDGDQRICVTNIYNATDRWVILQSLTSYPPFTYNSNNSSGNSLITIDSSSSAYCFDSSGARKDIRLKTGYNKDNNYAIEFYEW